MIKIVLERNDSENRPTQILFLDKSGDRFLVEYSWAGKESRCEGGVLRINVYKWEKGWERIWQENWDNNKDPFYLKRKATKIVKMFSKDYDYDNWNRNYLASRISKS